MVQNVSEPTYFGSGHVLNSKLVSEPCTQFCFCCKIDPKHDQNFIEHNFRHFLKTLHQGSYTRISHTCTRESAVHTSVHTTFLTNKHRKIPIITQFLCLIFKDIKDWFILRKNHLNVTTFTCFFNKNFRTHLYTYYMYLWATES